MAARQEREVARLHSFIERFRAKASKARQVQSRIKALNKLETIATYQELETFEWEFAAANKLPQPLVTLDGASAGYGERIVICGREPLGEPGRAHRHPGAQRGRQVHAHETHLGRIAALSSAGSGDRVARPI